MTLGDSRGALLEISHRKTAMADNFVSMSEQQLASLDALLAGREHQKWQSFYADRARPCPFFVDHPDENLAQWIDEGLVVPGRAIDLGCGHGRNAVYMAQRGFSVQAVDYSGSAVAWATERVAAAGVAVEITQQSVLDLELPPHSFDLVYDSGCFHHLPPHRRHQYVRLVADALKPGGVFGLVCFTPEGGNPWSDDEVYQQGSLGGGLGYTEERLRAIWSPVLRIDQLRLMRQPAPDAGVFGRGFLWCMLATKADEAR